MTFLSVIEWFRLKHKYLYVPAYTISYKHKFQFFYIFKITMKRNTALKYAPIHILKSIFCSLIGLWGNVVTNETQLISSPLRHAMNKWAYSLNKCSMTVDLVRVWWERSVVFGNLKIQNKTPKPHIWIFANGWCCSAHLL